MKKAKSFVAVLAGLSTVTAYAGTWSWCNDWTYWSGPGVISCNATGNVCDTQYETGICAYGVANCVVNVCEASIPTGATRTCHFAGNLWFCR